MTHELDALRAERRRLPWVKIEKPYVFKSGLEMSHRVWAQELRSIFAAPAK
jgi:predicted dithiol-disulfide oxidoreductase (DUF899 family)